MRAKNISLVMAMVMGLILSTMSMAVADSHLPSDGNVLGEDSIELGVACSTDMDDVPGVSRVADLPEGSDYAGETRYVAPWPFDGTDHGGLESFDWDNEDGDDVRDGDIDSPGADGHWYPLYPSEDGDHTIVYTFADGSTYTATASYSDDGCIESVTWTSAVIDIFVDVSGPNSREVGQAGHYTVDVANEGDDIDGNWQLALEVEGSDLSEDDIDLDWAGHTDIELELDDGILYVYGEYEDTPLTADYDETHNFNATFNKRGQFTGTVYVLKADA